MSDYRGKRFCILGDSICTYHGYTPAAAVFYDSLMQRHSGVLTVNDTWWMQVIDALEGTLGVNNSISGSTVHGTLRMSAGSDQRTQALGENGAPEVLLISMGGNDWGFGVAPKSFAKAYRKMLAKLKKWYPHAEIWCGTLLRGRLTEKNAIPFFNAEACGPLRVYNEAIRTEAIAAGCHVADLGEEQYDAMDEVHPNKSGMDFIAQCWLTALSAVPAAN